ncbi:hypothetical protein P171DRAFT_458070 [Karstenula rhodostoma CBS 690.94]|uniref:Rhodopsin domain-containing protein n=1 Tax=Karstenula rhodostoma CBS 690.94 TaxID=1392251 RepID=A0A9P4P938_9PLEO|nr:hypothetical protein P171DRAFT_458070 [Karstenula rhodostoma CBS 690.94]
MSTLPEHSPLPEDIHIPLSNKPETIIGVVTTFLCLSALAVSLRLLVRYKDRLWGWDDFFIVLAAVACGGGSLITCLMPQHGLGKHFVSLEPHTRVTYFKYVWASNLTYAFSTTFIKISILVQYLRLFKGRSDVARKTSWVILTFVTLWGLTFCLLGIFSCTPVAKNWDFTLEGKCIGWGSKNANEFFATWMAHASSNMCLDTLILALPVPFIRNLRMSGKTRTGLITLFILGGIAVSLSIARVIAISIKRIGTVPVFDPSWYTPTVYIFSVLELNMAILTASIPIFWPLVTSIAANKILIVNEIEIRTELIDNSFALSEQGKGFAGVGDDDPADDRASRISVMGKSDTDKLNRNNSRLSRITHHHKPSNSDSSDKALGLDMGRRVSQDSQRKLNLTHQTSSHSFGSGRLEDSPDLTHARYQNKFVQDWAVPDFEGPKAGRAGDERVFTTSVERAQVPYGALEK